MNHSESPNSYRIRDITAEADFAALREPWTALMAAIPDVPVFLTWEWVNAWWKHYGSGNRLWVLEAKSSDGQLVGIAPWMLVLEWLGPLPVRQVRFIGSGLISPVHMDIIACPEDREGVAAAFLAHLDRHRKEWDGLDMPALAGNGALKAAIAGWRSRHFAREEDACPFIVLPSSWDAYRMNVLGSNRRREIGNRQRRLERDFPGQVEYRRVSSQEELTRGIDALVDMQWMKWHAINLWTVFDNPDFVNFHRDVAAVCLDKGWLWFHTLEVSGKPIAAEYCFHYKDTLYGYQKGFDPDWGKYSPSTLLHAHVVQEAINQGVRVFDMMQGSDDFKNSWTDRARSDYHLQLSKSWRGNAWLASGVVYDAAKDVGRHILPKPVQRRINHLLGARRR